LFLGKWSKINFNFSTVLLSDGVHLASLSRTVSLGAVGQN